MPITIFIVLVAVSCAFISFDSLKNTEVTAKFIWTVFMATTGFSLMLYLWSNWLTGFIKVV